MAKMVDYVRDGMLPLRTNASQFVASMIYYHGRERVRQ